MVKSVRSNLQIYRWAQRGSLSPNQAVVRRGGRDMSCGRASYQELPVSLSLSLSSEEGVALQMRSFISVSKYVIKNFDARDDPMQDEPRAVYRFILSLQNLHDVIVLIRMDVSAIVQIQFFVFLCHLKPEESRLFSYCLLCKTNNWRACLDLRERKQQETA